MTTLYGYESFRSYLFELESALSNIGVRDCENLHATTQLAAAVYCLLRATSLFRATLSLTQDGLLDASDVTRRASWEAWMLGYEFRLESAARHAKLWHKKKHQHGIPLIREVEYYEVSHGIHSSSYGKAYGGLSSVCHSTKWAAENSIVTVSALHGGPVGRIAQTQSLILEGDGPRMMYLLIWTTFSEWPGMISLGIRPEDIPKSAVFYGAYDLQNLGSPSR
jgi:hypothetical protein